MIAPQLCLAIISYMQCAAKRVCSRELLSAAKHLGKRCVVIPFEYLKMARHLGCVHGQGCTSCFIVQDERGQQWLTQGQVLAPSEVRLTPLIGASSLEHHCLAGEECLQAHESCDAR
jgi:hypothetical protein